MVPIYRVTVMSWCFQFLLDLLWIPLVAFFRDIGLSLNIMGAVFAANLGVRILPNIAATKLGAKTDVVCMLCGLVGFAVNFAWPTATWAIFVMSASGGMTFVRAHLSVHGKKAAGSSIERLTLAAKWSGAARNAGTVVAFVLPVCLYSHLGWRAVLTLAMAVMCTYIVLALFQHRSSGGQEVETSTDAAVLVESTAASVPWIDWVVAGSFCVTELQMNVQAAAVPTTLMKTFNLPMSLVGVSQSFGQLIAMGALVLLSKGGVKLLQKRPLNLIVSFFGTFVGMTVLWATTSFMPSLWWFFILMLYFFYISAYTAQVTMLECLTGVLDMQSSIIVMGYSEMVGCAFSLVGGYLGPALLEVDPAAPFAMQAVIALLTTVVLALTLGHRATAQTVVCQTEEQYVDSLADTIKRRPSLRNSFQGLQMLSTRKETYIKVEQLLRAQSTQSLASMASQDSEETSLVTNTQESEEVSEALPTTTPPMARHLSLEQHLLDRQPRKAKELPMPDHVTSTLRARQFKKAMVSFELAYLDLDTKDHQIQVAGNSYLVATRQPKSSHRRVQSML